MGNICPKQNHDDDDRDSHQSTQISKKKSLIGETGVGNENSSNSMKNNSREQSPSRYKKDNSFAIKHQIGPYFCGGSLIEKEAMSYPKRVMEFENILKKSEKEKKKKKQKAQKVSKQEKGKEIKDDMQNTFEQKFNFLPGLLQVSPKILQKTIKKGPPIKYRWVSWKSHLFTISNELCLEQTCKNYEKMIFLDSKETVQIEKDINRTFPSLPYFAQKNIEDNMNSSDSVIGYLPLKRVLIAISNLYPQLGYCQGMNFILGFILMINEANEGEAFWMFKILAEHPDFMLMGLYENELPLLQFLEYFAKQLLDARLPNLMKFFENQNIPDSFWLTKWFLTLFLYNFPVKICSRLWDYFITNDIFSLIKLMVPILEIFQETFMKQDACSFLEGFTELTQNEQELMDPNSKFYFNLTEIVQKADLLKIDKKMISKAAKQFLDTENNQNEYAFLYSLYDNPSEFSIAHQQLIKSKIKNMSDLNVLKEQSLEESREVKSLQENMKYQSNRASVRRERTLSNRETIVELGGSNNNHHNEEEDEGKGQQKKEDLPQEQKPELFNIPLDEKEVNQLPSQNIDQISRNSDIQKKRTSKAGERRQPKEEEMRETLEFDVESFQLFQSLINKSAETPNQIKKHSPQKSSEGGNSIDKDSQKSSYDSKIAQVQVEEVQEDDMNRQKFLANKLFSESDSSVHSQQGPNGSQLSDEKIKKLEIHNYQIS